MARLKSVQVAPPHGQGPRYHAEGVFRCIKPFRSARTSEWITAPAHAPRAGYRQALYLDTMEQSCSAVTIPKALSSTRRASVGLSRPKRLRINP